MTGNNTFFFQAITIQRNVRGWLARNDCAKKKTNIILIQATVRRFLARKR